jgi:hypothetical protein
MSVTARRSGGDDFICKYDWPCFVQSGDSGVVFSKEGGYTTAFFEAFPKEPKCFLRGEGKTIEEAEEDCWQRYQKVLTCDHEMDRRNRTDGYAYCKHCSYASTVFEPLTKCCKCKKPAAHGQDYHGKWYCKKHYRYKPLDPNTANHSRFFNTEHHKHRIPRKYKKKIKEAASFYFFIEHGIVDKVKCSVSIINDIRLRCGGVRINLLFERQRQRLLDTLTEKKKCPGLK